MQDHTPSPMVRGSGPTKETGSASRRLSPLRPGLFLGLIAFICVVLVGLQGWHQWTDRAERLRAAEIATANITTSLARSVDQTLEMADVMLAWASRELEAEGPSPATLQRLTRHFTAALSAAPHLRGFAVHLVDGEPLATWPEELLAGMEAGGRAAASLPPGEGSPYLLQHSTGDGRWSLGLSRSFRGADQRLAGTVLVHIDIDAFIQDFQGLDLGRKGAVSLFRDDGALLARSPPAEEAAAWNLANHTEFHRTITGRDSGSFSAFRGVDGVIRLGSFRHAESYPVLVFAAVARDEVLADWAEDARLEFGAVLLLACLSCLIGFNVFRQVRQRQATEQALEQSEASFRLLAEHAGDIVSRLRPDGAISYVSPAAQRLFGRAPGELMGHHLNQFIHPEDQVMAMTALKRLAEGEEQVSVTCRLGNPAAAPVWTETIIRAIRDTKAGKPHALVAVSRDVTERRAAALQLEEQARTDGLTGLSNRRHFDETLQAEWSRSARDGTPISLILLDVDHFKRFNDRYGHQAGDECLQAVARAISNTMRRPGDLAARYGGEEFAAILPATDEAGGAQVAEQVRAAVEALGLPHAGNAGSGVVTASLGIATMLPNGKARASNPRQLIAAADSALYAAKSGGRNRVGTAEGAELNAGQPPS